MDEKNKNGKISRSLQQEPKTEYPSWMSRNEGVHERVNFDDTLWGFELAGGAYYDTPLRVTKAFSFTQQSLTIVGVKPNSRALHAGIHVGDVLQSINGIGTHTLTVQEAHDVILDSGMEIKLNFYAPDVLETMYYVYQDEMDDEADDARKRQDFEEPVYDLRYKGAKTNQSWSMAWPCNKKRDILYKESNCFMVPSTYERRHARRLLKTEAMDNNE